MLYNYQSCPIDLHGSSEPDRQETLISDAFSSRMLISVLSELQENFRRWSSRRNVLRTAGRPFVWFQTLLVHVTCSDAIFRNFCQYIYSVSCNGFSFLFGNCFFYSSNKDRCPLDVEVLNQLLATSPAVLDTHPGQFTPPPHQNFRYNDCVIGGISFTSSTPS